MLFFASRVSEILRSRNEKSHSVSVQICIRADLKRMPNKKGALTSSVRTVASNNSHHCTSNRRARRDRCHGRSNYVIKKSLITLPGVPTHRKTSQPRRGESVASLELIAKSQNVEQNIDRAISNRLTKIESYKENLENCNNMREQIYLSFSSKLQRNSFTLHFSISTLLVFN